MVRDERQGVRHPIGTCLLSSLFSLSVLVAGHGAVALELPEGAHAAEAFHGGDPQVELSLLIDAAVAPPGESVSVGVLFEMAPGWHIYWRNPGELGRATHLHWTVEEGQVGPVQWPAPSVFVDSSGGPSITTYGYEGQVLLWSRATFEREASESARTGVWVGETREVGVRVEVDFVACRVGCIPGHVSLQSSLSLGPELRPADPETRALFARYRERLPVAPEDLGLKAEVFYSQSAIRPGDAFTAAISLACSDSARWAGTCETVESGAQSLPGAFIPGVSDWLEFAPTAYGVHPEAEGALVLVLSGRAIPTEARGESRLRGVIPLRTSDGRIAHVEVDLSLPRAPRGVEVRPTSVPLPEAPAFEPKEPGKLPLWYAVVLALLGGLILNLMPCVLPVLAIKVFHLAELAHRNRRETLAHGVAYAAGVLLTMLGLAVGVLVLRAAGTAVGWGFQFQQPLFIAAISTVLLVFALNLFGVFEIGFDASSLAGVGGGRAGWRRSLFEGLLAVVLATPCTAPFLGTAVGFAFASRTEVIFAIFLAIGVGLAAPYVLVTLVPAWARVIPRSGPWMIQVRKALGFALVATLVWLLWVMGRLVGIDGQTLLSAYLVSVAFATWLFGLLQARGGSRLVGWVFTALGLVVLLELPLSVPSGAAPGDEVEVRESTPSAEWRPYDAEAIRTEVERGRLVFVDFTADWCITCKVNERVVIADGRVQAEFARLDVATFRADFTRYDEKIREELARFGKAGVPLYLLYRPHVPLKPVVLPELLTVQVVLDALGRAVATASKDAG